MARELNTKCLDGAAKYYAGLFFQDTGPRDRQWVMKELYGLKYRDAFSHVTDQMRQIFGPQSKSDFASLSLSHFTDRTDEVFEQMLKEWLAIDPDGTHVAGQVGRVQVGSRKVGLRPITVEAPWSIRRRKMLGLPKSPETRELIQRIAMERWPIYAGEEDERSAGDPHGVCDTLPIPELYMATVTRISNECAILGCNAIVDNLDEGTGAAVIQGRTGSQPADPDTTTTGTNLCTNVCSDPAFGNAADASPGGRATASAISDDTSADATGTLGYIRASSTNDGATPLDDHIDANVATSAASFNFNTLNFVAGSTVSITSWTFTLSESNA